VAAFASSVDSAAQVFLPTLGDDATVDGDDGHHLQRVLRLRTGQVVIGADGRGGWRPYAVRALGPGRVELAATGGLEEEPTPRPTLTIAFALTKRDKPERVVQQLTEIGIDRILAVAAERSVVRWDERQAGQAVARWERVARGAAEQSRRARLPEVGWLPAIGELVGRNGLVVATVGGRPVLDVALGPSEEVIALIGPEGGFSDSECAMLLGVPTLSVGHHVLRAETAACVVGGCLTALRARSYNGA
jgi:16S rRNA (uracil1498-N3)-methyltransferase